jgi:hypothetical protein
LLFVVPGFISLKTWRIINPSQPLKAADQLLDLVVFSLLNYVLLFWLVNWGNAIDRIDVGVAIHLAVLLIFPLLWPILVRGILTSRFLQGKVIHPTPTSWDFFFSKGKPCFVLIHLKTGKLIGGLYDGESFASSYPEPRDLYLSEVWKIDSSGAFSEPIDQTAGVLIAYDQIAYLELFETAPVEDTDARTNDYTQQRDSNQAKV